MDKTKNALKWIIGILNKHKIEYQISGGLAGRMFGSNRELHDIDIDISERYFSIILPEIKEYIIYGPDRYKDAKWDVELITLNYFGQEIDISGVDTILISNKERSKWIHYPSHLDKTLNMKIDGLEVEIINLKDFIEYKKELDGEHQLEDIKAAEKYLIQKILENYNIGNLEHLKIIPIGVSSKNYEIKTTTGLYFLKKHRKNAGLRIDSIEKVEKFFSKKEIPVICPIPTKENKLHCFYEGDCYVLYPFIPGISFTQENIPNQAIIRMAEMLAKIHLLGKDPLINFSLSNSRYFLPEKSENLIRDIDYFLEKILNMEEKSDYDNEAYEALLFKKELALKFSSETDNFSFEEFNLGHGDFHPGNIFFDSKNNISAIYDFDMSGPQPRIYELVRAMMLTCFDNSFAKKNFKKAKIFIKTYYELYPFLKEDFKQAVNCFYFKGFSVWRERAHYNENNRRTDKTYLLSNKTLKYMTENREFLIDSIYDFLLFI
ncbi:MAG: phosphotransferase [Candidatus Paceibacterota bacterium]